MGLTLLGCTPGCIALFRRPTVKNLILGCVSSAISFFLFSFQVHEKSFLLVIVPLSLLCGDHPMLVCFYSIVAAFSMFPLLERDGLGLPYLAMMMLAGVMLFSCDRNRNRMLGDWVYRCAAVAMALTHLIHATIPPPARYPDLWIMLFAVVSFLLIVLLYLIVTGLMLWGPIREKEQVEGVEEKKMN
eukprot:TRINITY_DN6947_c0_g2_i1.p1 TRINITY_DN6947_c0_g2~~TRINITY_DN6947_c0_g2_i1.p1  ORF type:complete len:187 (+),score=41.43 TRINITY_DN6947_c0_g2_i1:174-734(+)